MAVNRAFGVFGEAVDVLRGTIGLLTRDQDRLTRLELSRLFLQDEIGPDRASWGISLINQLAGRRVFDEAQRAKMQDAARALAEIIYSSFPDDTARKARRFADPGEYRLGDRDPLDVINQVARDEPPAAVVDITDRLGGLAAPSDAEGGINYIQKIRTIGLFAGAVEGAIVAARGDDDLNLLGELMRLIVGDEITPNDAIRAIVLTGRLKERFVPDEVGSAKLHSGERIFDGIVKRGHSLRIPEDARIQLPDALREKGVTKKIDPDRLLVTDRGVVAVKGTPSGDTSKGRMPLIVVRTPPWAVRDLFGYDVQLFIAAGARLRLGTGEHDTDVEFPGYFGKFVLQRRGDILLFPEELDAARRITRLSYLGREWGVQAQTLAASYPEGADIPDLNLEAIELESPFPHEGAGGLWQYHFVERMGVFEYRGWRVEHLGGTRWRIHDGGKYLGDIDIDDFPVKVRTVRFMQDVLENPLLGVDRHLALFQGRPTVVPLGSGSGFTKEEASSHMLIDESGEVTIVDPNIQIIESLHGLGIPLGRVRRIVATHVHFDHVAGIWRLIRHLPHRADLVIHANPGDEDAIRTNRQGEGEMSTLKALVDIAVKATNGEIAADQMIGAVRVVPIKFGQDFALGTFTARFFHGNHSHPSVGYQIANPTTGRPAFLFTGDTRMDAYLLHSARERPDKKDPEAVPVMGERRAEFLSRMVPMTLLAGGAVYADAGVSPLHPTIKFYERMVAGLEAVGIAGEFLDYIKEGLFLFHEGRAKVEGSGFKYAGYGWNDAVALSKQLNWNPKDLDQRREGLISEGLARVPVLASLSSEDREHLASLGRMEIYEAGSELMRDGEDAGDMVLILDGMVAVSRDEGAVRRVLATLTSGLVGEALIAGEPVRNADVVARTNTIVLRLGADAVDFMREKGLAPRFVKVRELRRRTESGDGRLDILSELSSEARDAIFLYSDVVLARDGDVVIREGEVSSDLFVVLDGELVVSSTRGELSARPVRLGRGGVVGEGTLLGGAERSATVTAAGDAQLLHLSEEDARRILEMYGGDARYYLLGIAQERGSVRKAPQGEGAVPSGRMSAEDQRAAIEALTDLVAAKYERASGSDLSNLEKIVDGVRYPITPEMAASAAEGVAGLELSPIFSSDRRTLATAKRVLQDIATGSTLDKPKKGGGGDGTPSTPSSPGTGGLVVSPGGAPGGQASPVYGTAFGTPSAFGDASLYAPTMVANMFGICGAFPPALSARMLAGLM